MTSMEGRVLRLAIRARNPQRRPVLTLGGRPARADEGDADGSGAVFRRDTASTCRAKYRGGTTVIIPSDL